VQAQERCHREPQWGGQPSQALRVDSSTLWVCRLEWGGMVSFPPHLLTLPIDILVSEKGNCGRLNSETGSDAWAQGEGQTLPLVTELPVLNNSRRGPHHMSLSPTSSRARQAGPPATMIIQDVTALPAFATPSCKSTLPHAFWTHVSATDDRSQQPPPTVQPHLSAQPGPPRRRHACLTSFIHRRMSSKPATVAEV